MDTFFFGALIVMFLASFVVFLITKKIWVCNILFSPLLALHTVYLLSKGEIFTASMQLAILTVIVLQAYFDHPRQVKRVLHGKIKVPSIILFMLSSQTKESMGLNHTNKQ
jgi:hypothetical protein